MLAIIDPTTLKLPAGQYRDKAFGKRHICLHFTAGYNASGALNTWKKTSWRDGTAFILDRDGHIYQVFDPRYWAVHIYRHKKGEELVKYQLEQQSVGIEIVNLGPLSLGKTAATKDTLYTYTNKPYCKLTETERYVQATWKNKHYWQSYTPAQYEALRILLPEMERDFQIPIKAAPLGDRLAVWDAERMAGWRGVTTHCNYRSDKFDVGPAFDWQKAGIPA